MKLTKNTIITKEIADLIGAMTEGEKQKIVDAMTTKQAHDLFMILLKP